MDFGIAINKKSPEISFGAFRASGRTRTCNLLVRSQLRYPVTPHSHLRRPKYRTCKIFVKGYSQDFFIFFDFFIGGSPKAYKPAVSAPKW